MTNEIEPTSRNALEAFVKELGTDYLIWYSKSVRRVYNWYWSLQLIILISGFVTSVLASFSAAGFSKSWLPYVLIALPSLGSLSAAVLLQFRVYDLWRLREAGRIAFQDLEIIGNRLLAAATSDEECSQIHQELQERTSEIERDQSNNFFGLSSSSFVAQFSGNQERESPKT